MSDTTPPPLGPRPSGPPPEYLTAGGGSALPPTPASAGSGGGGRKAAIGAAAVVGLAAVGAGVWAAVSFFATGPQPAEALPAGTVGYVSIDLDPGGAQKIEALRTLRKFPAFKDEIGLETDDDLRERLFAELQDTDTCQELDYADDIEPWLGDRVAVAAVDLGEDDPVPVLVVQVKDADAADAGMSALRECGAGGAAGGEELGGWSIDGEWAVVAETQEQADDVAAAAGEASLADDDDYQRWTEAAGDPGILTAYAAPEVGTLLAETVDDLGSDFLGDEVDSDCGWFAYAPEPGSDPTSPPMPMEDYEGYEAYDCGDVPSEPAVPDELTSMFEGFDGMALTVRFDDGSLEVESASSSDFLGLGSLSSSDRGGEAIASLPEDTALALGIGFEDGWVDEMIDYATDLAGSEMDVEEMFADLEDETGMTMPEDAETLAGESMALAVGGDADLEAFLDSGEVGGVPMAVKIKGDPDEIDAVLEKLRATMPADEPEALEILASDSEGDYVVLGPDPDYRAEVLADGGLGDSETFEDVVREAGDAATVLYVDFDAVDGWLADLSDGDPEVADNLEPLSGLGLTGWQDDDGVAHSVLRITTD